jgi:RNA polymerase sigma-70 factor (ECF subfamily)
MIPDERHSEVPASAAQFQATRWSIVLAAGDTQSPQAGQALAVLCQTYWYPIYAFIRRSGHAPHDAQDLTQSFFEHLIEDHALRKVERRKGKFRSFLITATKNFLNNEWDRNHAKKRGGDFHLVSWDAEQAEARYAWEPRDEVSPDKLFDQNWTLALLEIVQARLEREYQQAGKAALFKVLRNRMFGDTPEATWQELATTLQMEAGAVRMAATRLRQRFREVLREEIAQTVGTLEEVEEEMRYLRGLPVK